MASQSALSSFKSQIGWSSLSDPTSPEGWVLLKKVKPLPIPFMNDMGWELRNEFIIPLSPGLVQESWFFKHEDSAITIHVIVSSKGYELARQHLLDSASTTMTVHVPYQLSEVSIGDKAIVALENPFSHQVIWVFKNVCAKVSISANDIPDIFPIAMRLQQYFEENLIAELQDHLPLVNLRAKLPQKLGLGQTLTVEIREEGNKDIENLLINPVIKGNHLEIINQDQMTVRVDGKNVGLEELTIWVIDKRTLLSNSQMFELEVISLE